MFPNNISNSDLTHCFVIKSHLRCDVVPFKWCLKMYPQGISRVTIQTKRIPIVKSYTSQVSQLTGLMQHCAVMSFALKWTSEICNKATWCNHNLEFYTVNTLVAIIHDTMIILWTSNTSNSAIHKTKTVIKWHPLLVNSICVSMQLSLIHI